MVADEEDEMFRQTCTLENFKEIDEVMVMIDNLKNIYNDKRTLESQYDKLYDILKQYYEQPNLLDRHLEKILSKFIAVLRDDSSAVELKHAMFDYMYQIVRVRGYKIVVRHLPHEISDLQPVLTFLEAQDVRDMEKWRSRYVLLMWLSIIIIMPFHMARLDGFQPGEKDEHGNPKKTVMQRIFDICKVYVTVPDACQEAGAFLSSKFLTRSDVKDAYLVGYLDWSMNDEEHKDFQHGVLAALAAILKRGRREDLLPHASGLLRWITKYAGSNDIVIGKLSIKLIQRIALLFLKPRLAKWRYTQGCRSLAINLLNPNTTALPQNSNLDAGDTNIENDDDDNEDVPEEVEECCGLLITGLGDASSKVRWSAAKGIARVAGRLPKAAASDVATSVLETMHSSCCRRRHGGCLATAELTRRGLLAEGRPLGAALQGALAALARDEEAPGGGGAGGGGAARDAACHVAWAAARAYAAPALRPHAPALAAALAATAVFDREINCRRAAAAAFQENVGRHGLFPDGIEVLTIADYKSVGPRACAFLKVAPRLARLQAYAEPLAAHLIEHKIMHWEEGVRELASRALGALLDAAAAAGRGEAAALRCAAALRPLLRRAREPGGDPRARHGAALASARLAAALRRNAPHLLASEVINDLADLIPVMEMNGSFKGLGGELMRSAACEAITCLAESDIEFGEKPVIESWCGACEEWLGLEWEASRAAAAGALAAAARRGGPQAAAARDLPRRLARALAAPGRPRRAGAAEALRRLPPDLLAPHFAPVVKALCDCATITDDTSLWTESRRDALRSLTSVLMNSEEMQLPAEERGAAMAAGAKTLAEGLGDYTWERRGDTGSRVREAAAAGLRRLLPAAARALPAAALAPLAAAAAAALLRLGAERIDRTRALAARAFIATLLREPKIPGIPRHDELLLLFPKDSYEEELSQMLPQNEKDTDADESLAMDVDNHDNSDDKNTGAASILWLFPSHTMPLFVRLLKFEEYRYHLLLGLSSSAGDLTESLVKHTTNALWEQLWQLDEDEVLDVCKTLVKVFSDHLRVDRITVPMLRFLDRLIGSGCINTVLEDTNCSFAEDILNLVKSEVAGNKSIYKLLDAINVLCQLVQVLDTGVGDDGVESKATGVAAKALSKLLIWLCCNQRYARRAAAARIYEALAVRCATDARRVEALSILATQDWELEPPVVRPVRDRLAVLLGVPKPVLVNKP